MNNLGRIFRKEINTYVSINNVRYPSDLTYFYYTKLITTNQYKKPLIYIYIYNQRSVVIQN